MTRDITDEQAHLVLDILTEECGYRLDKQSAAAFVRAIIAPQPDGSYVCREYRFCGALGFGGKFRNNGNHDNTPYVDCYREDETPERLAMIKSANRRLAAIFAQ